MQVKLLINNFNKDFLREKKNFLRTNMTVLKEVKMNKLQYQGVK